tara:strand:- start:126 stop:287 length:162 start_codon:yes stop_codon:yes gene_type:complete
MSFRKMFTEHLVIEGWSNCCDSPVYTPNTDGIGLCSHCGEWAEIVQIEEDEDE